MPARREHWYNVAMSGRIRTRMTYSGSSWTEARHALGLAIVKASHLRLAYSVHVLRDYEPIVRVKVEHL
jgi:hypothetical protein